MELSRELGRYRQGVAEEDVEMEGSEHEKEVGRLRARAYFVATSAFVWRKTNSEEVEEQLLVTGQMDGSVLRWRLMYECVSSVMHVLM